MRSDIKSHIAPVQTIAPAAYTATATGTGVDLANYDAAAVVVTVGAVTNNTFAVEVQESDQPASGYTAVPDGLLDGAEPATLTAATTTVIGYHGIRRYLRVVATTSAGNAVFGATVVRGHGRIQP
ncbi:hypothetical protein ABZ714_19510 [Streptomyces sp. NPDC006798]|uniref:hypothetical protein n=1 Tax=Streptomyces sp. NPDC006798 TaxID=3155462 RepID=UPI003405639C